MPPPRYRLVSLSGYFTALLCIVISVFIYSRNLTLRSKLDEVQVEYETLLAEKLQLERSYYRLKEVRSSGRSLSDSFPADRFSDSLRALKHYQEAEIEKLRRELETLRGQLITPEKK